jgi:hypothetical protein
MTDAERHVRAQRFRQEFEPELPNFAATCHESADFVILHQDAFAADYQEAEFSLLGRPSSTPACSARKCG